MDDNDKLGDRSNSIFHINVEKADCGTVFKPIKNGIIYWNENVNLTSYVDLYFQEDAEFTKVPNWKQIMQDTFDNWQRQRQDIEYDPVVQMSPMTSLTIMEPQERCTISINIPFKKLGDHGDQIVLYNEVVNIFKHYNFIANETIFPIDQIRTVTRGKKNQKIIEQKQKAWNRWKIKNQRYFNKQSKEKQIALKHQHFTDQILINQIFIEFKVWVDKIPKYIDYTVGQWDIKRKNSRLSKLEKRIKSMYQCYSCGGNACRDKRCRHFNKKVTKLCQKNGIDYKNDKNGYEKMKKLMGRFCHHCGKTGGHHGENVKCEQFCKWCKSHDHDSTVNPKCPYWNCWGIIS